ncbi:MAG TPA: beta-ketoacyl synthase N-terminal-like domain-containing protein [Candidatus Competibacteraceae bacterium]|nr:beta-ketoacyl synthase N-terminal-like domain-containing protein [Candidatus Competibacteraceae bacterium]HSA45286.1 beta-ketoacyl synthase N-terminal-like domain-containing protein [Candidatus Competibacteraceae bacterium]
MTDKAAFRHPVSGDDIAIIGMACLFPGAADLRQYWENILNKVDAIGEPLPEWGAERYYDPDDRSGERIYTKKGGFLRDLARFDPAEFGVMPNSVDGGEPDQFLALKIATAALRDAGYLDPGHDHGLTGIILGHSTYLHRGQATLIQHSIVLDQTLELLAQLRPDLESAALADLRHKLKAKLPPFNAATAPGLVPNVMTGRIANRLDFRGPNFLIDAACASSLLAVASAMDLLRDGRADLMLAGGVNATLPPQAQQIFCQLSALSHRSTIRPFDSSADGTLLGEGLGVIVLKRLADAQRDDDRIYAVLKAVGQASDGRALGLLAPRLEGEVLAIRRAYEQAGVEPRSLGLIEAHGTGIPLGDQTEVAALRAVLGDRRAGQPPRCALGSVKSMISHCIPAAGIAGLIKAALALHHKILPPTLCETVSPALGIEQTPLYVNTAPRPWIHGGVEPRRAGVNAFGFGGVNTHAILEEAPPAANAPPRWPLRDAELIVLAAADRLALQAAVGELMTRLDGPLSLHAIARQTVESLSQGPQRLALVARDREDLRRKLCQVVEKTADSECHQLRTRGGLYFCDQPLEGQLAFLFPGEGSQYPGMLADLACQFPEVRDWFDFWDTLHPEATDVLPSDSVFPPSTGLTEIERETLRKSLYTVYFGSEALFIANQALLSVLKRLEVRPDLMVGHSTGENSALAAAGAVRYPRRELLREPILKLRRIYQTGAEEQGIPRGALLAVGALDRRVIVEEMAAAGDGLYLAMDNCTQQVVLFGEREVIARTAERFKARGGLCAYLDFDRPYHTPLFAPVVEVFARFYQEMPVRPPDVPLYSCASAAPFPIQPDAIRELASAQWAAPVRFAETIERMYSDGARLFLEVGPGGNLTAFVKDILKGRAHLAIAVNDRHRSGWEQLLHALSVLFVHGRSLNLAELCAEEPAEGVSRRRPRPEPALDNTLPYLRFSAEELKELRPHVTLLPKPDSSSIPLFHKTPSPLAGEGEGGGGEQLARQGVMLRHLELMQDFLTTQSAMMIGQRAGYPVKRFPFVHRVISLQPERVEVEYRLALGRDRFLSHHILSGPVSMDPGLTGLAVAPLAVALEMLAEAATCLARFTRLIRLSNVRAHRWIAMDEQEDLPVRITAVRQSAPTVDQEVLHAILWVEGQPVVEADVRFAASGLDHPPPPLTLRERRPSRWRDEELYAIGMFHGPLFQSIRRLEAWDDYGIDAQVVAPTINGFLRADERPALLFSPALLDAVGQLSAYWISQQVGVDFSSFPSRIERIDFITTDWPEDEILRLQGRFTTPGPALGTFVQGDYWCLRADGTPLFRVQGWWDRYLPVPHRFYQVRHQPLTGYLGEDWSALFPDSDAVVWCVAALPDGFLEEAGALWRRVLARIALNRDERQHWRALPETVEARNPWLLERIALKEAARHWAWSRQGQRHYAADLHLQTREGAWLTAVADRNGNAVPLYLAAVVRQGNVFVVASRRRLGIAALRFDAAIEETRFVERLESGERDWLARQSTTQQGRLARRLLCAKAAVSRWLGLSSDASPEPWLVPPYSDAVMERARLTHAAVESAAIIHEQAGWVVALAEGVAS